jgi:hypothetical protein
MVDRPRLIFPVVGLSSHCSNQHGLAEQQHMKTAETHKVYLNIANGTAPSVKAKDLIGKVDDLFRREIVHLATSCSWSCGNVFGSELSVQATLQGCNLLSRVFVDVYLLLLEWIAESVVLPLITGSDEREREGSLAMFSLVSCSSFFMLDILTQAY